MKNKKLSHNGLQGSVTSVMAALLCILIGLFAVSYTHLTLPTT